MLMSINRIIMRTIKTGSIVGQKVKCMVYEEAVKSKTTLGGIWNSNKPDE